MTGHGESHRTVASELVVGLMGLPSAGKSSAVNALCGKRLRQSGVCRTTKNVHLIGTMELCRELEFPEEHFTKHALVSDDGVPFGLLDFPGVADIEDTEDLFSAMSVKWGLACDVICWVSDIRTSFMTVHEQNEFDKVRETINKYAQITGRLYQFCILLAKYDFDDERKVLHCPTTVFNDEIVEPEEETTILDCLARVEILFPQIPIAKFNAFGRIAYGKSTEALRLLLARVPPPQDINTSYVLNWAVDDLPFRRQKCLLNSLMEQGFELGDATTVRQKVMTFDEPRVLRELVAYIVLNNPPRTCVAQQIGILPSLDPYVHEIDGSIMPTRAAVVCILALVGANHMVYIRTYLRAAECETLECEHACHATYLDALCNVERCKCRQHTFAIPRMLCHRNHEVHPVIFDLDITLNTDAAVSCRRSFLSLVGDVRRQVWGDEDDDADVPSIVHLVLSGRLSSLLAPLSSLPQTFYDILDRMTMGKVKVPTRTNPTDESMKPRTNPKPVELLYRMCDDQVQFFGPGAFYMKDDLKKAGATWMPHERRWVMSNECGIRFMVENAENNHRVAFRPSVD